MINLCHPALVLHTFTFQPSEQTHVLLNGGAPPPAASVSASASVLDEFAVAELGPEVKSLHSNVREHPAEPGSDCHGALNRGLAWRQNDTVRREHTARAFGVPGDDRASLAVRAG
jgi:hypothetical protein